MAKRVSRLAAAAVLLVVQTTASLCVGDMFLQGNGASSMPAETVRQDDARRSLPVEGGAPPPPRAGIGQTARTGNLLAPREDRPRWNGPAAPDSEWEHPIRLPAVDLPPATVLDRDVPNRDDATNGAVRGRLLNRGRPLVDCRVVLVPLKKDGGSYSVDGEAQPLRVATNAEGAYDFDNVPPGPYKLYWLPKGRNRWIHRIELRPDVVVRQYRTERIRDIRIAMTTIN